MVMPNLTAQTCVHERRGDTGCFFWGGVFTLTF